MSHDSELRGRILDAVAPLAQIYPLHDLSIDILAEAAALEAAAFRAEFASVHACVGALQQRFMDGLRVHVMQVALSCPAGYARLKAGSSTYLDVCLENRALRTWLIPARQYSLDVAEGLRRQNETYIVILAPEFKTIGWPLPQAAARIYMAMLMEASLVEHAQARALTAARDTLWDFLKTY